MPKSPLDSVSHWYDGCTDCDEFAVARAPYHEGKEGEWIRCSCGNILWATRYFFKTEHSTIPEFARGD